MFDECFCRGTVDCGRWNGFEVEQGVMAELDEDGKRLFEKEETGYAR